MIEIKYIALREGAHIPQKAHEDDAGFDLYASEDFLLKAHGFGCVPTAISIELPTGYEAQVRPRSGLAAKYGVTVLNAPGTIDAGYRGEVKVILINHSIIIAPEIMPKKPPTKIDTSGTSALRQA